MSWSPTPYIGRADDDDGAVGGKIVAAIVFFADRPMSVGTRKCNGEMRLVPAKAATMSPPVGRTRIKSIFSEIRRRKCYPGAVGFADFSNISEVSSDEKGDIS